MRASIVSTKSHDWSTLLAATEHDAYHLPGYVEVAATHEAGEGAAIVVVDDSGHSLLLPVVMRDLPDGDRDAISPYGTPGPLTIGTDSPEFAAAAMDAAISHLGAENIVSLFVRLHPLMPVAGLDRVGTVVSHGPTVAIDLGLSDAALWEQTRPNHRRDIRRTMKAGYTCRIDDFDADDKVFRRLYRSTMRRTDASSFYFFDDNYFDGLRLALGPRLHLATLISNGQVAAAALLTESCRILQLHLVGSDEGYLRVSPTKQLYHEVTLWAKQRGLRWFHLGGGVGGSNDGLLGFKSGFASPAHQYETLRIVTDKQRYRELATANGATGDLDDLSGFFPAYRKPPTAGS